MTKCMTKTKFAVTMNTGEWIHHPSWMDDEIFNWEI